MPRTRTIISRKPSEATTIPATIVPSSTAGGPVDVGHTNGTSLLDERQQVQQVHVQRLSSVSSCNGPAPAARSRADGQTGEAPVRLQFKPPRSCSRSIVAPSPSPSSHGFVGEGSVNNSVVGGAAPSATAAPWPTPSGASTGGGRTGSTATVSKPKPRRTIISSSVKPLGELRNVPISAVSSIVNNTHNGSSHSGGVPSTGTGADDVDLFPNTDSGTSFAPATTESTTTGTAANVVLPKDKEEDRFRSLRSQHREAGREDHLGNFPREGTEPELLPAPAPIHVVPRTNQLPGGDTRQKATTHTAAQNEEEELLDREVEEEMRQNIDLGFTPGSHIVGAVATFTQLMADDDDPRTSLLPSQHGVCPSSVPSSIALTRTPPGLRPPEDAKTFYGLPPEAELIFQGRGIKKLYHWQEDIVNSPDVCGGKNLVYSLPTSGGKTLVAEILLLRCAVNRRQSGLFILPFISVAEEKLAALRPFGEALSFTCEGYFGTNGRFPAPQSPSVFICTIEKANSLMNHLAEEGRLEELGCIVIDELHMVGEPQRGATLELLLSKVLLTCPQMQIIGMSATIPNLQQLADWLHARCFVCDFRPIPLQQYVVSRGEVLQNDQRVRVLPAGNEQEAMTELVLEVAPASSVLVFCASRAKTVECAKYLSQLMSSRQALHRKQCIETLLGEVKAAASSKDEQLASIITSGVAFHHGGLLMEERYLIERAYRERLVTVLCCTSTLAAGVNLPARRVIFRTPYIGREFLTKSRYMQMCGRAGRAGLDTCGESFLILPPRDREMGMALDKQELEPVLTTMRQSTQELARCLLECISVGLVRSPQGFHRWRNSSLSMHAPPSSPSCRPPDVKVPSRSSSPGPEPIAEEEKEEADPLQQDLEAAIVHLLEGGFIELSWKEDPTNNASVASPLLPNTGSAAETSLRSTTGTAIGANTTTTVTKPTQKDLLQNIQGVCRLMDTAAPSVLQGHQGSGCAGGGEESASSVEARLSAMDNIRITTTPFGASTVKSCFVLQDALMVRGELENLQENGLILSDELHICYFLTPPREIFDCDWQTYRTILSRLSTRRQKIAVTLGVDESFVEQRAGGIMRPCTGTDELQSFTTKRFFVALILSDLLNEVPMEDVESKYQVTRGQVQNLMKNASIFSSSMTNFCNALGWFTMEAVLASFVKRLGFGVKPDLLPLMEIKGVQAAKARALWNAGFKEPKSLVNMSAADLVAKVKECNDLKVSKSAKFFNLRTALAVTREATRLIFSKIRDMKGELAELQAGNTGPTPNLTPPAPLHQSLGHQLGERPAPRPKRTFIQPSTTTGQQHQ